MRFIRELLKNENTNVKQHTKKEKISLKFTFVGGIMLLIGILMIDHGTDIRNLELGFGGMGVVIGGGMVLLTSFVNQIGLQKE